MLSEFDPDGVVQAFLAARFESDIDCEAIRQAMSDAFADDARLRLCAPFGDLTGSTALWDELYRPLRNALPDAEFRDFIVMAGPRWRNDTKEQWLGIAGNVVGTFVTPWIGIPPNGDLVFFRYHEFMRFEAGQVVEMEAIWDIPQLMIQAGAWTMPPQPGVEWICPAPARRDLTSAVDPAAVDASVQLVWDMLHDLQQGDAATPGRGLGQFWHDDAMWYGPAGIGTARGHRGIRDTVLKGFRTGLSNNVRHLEEGVFFGDGDLVAFTGWPSGTATHSGEGFLGLAPTGNRFTRRSLDFWRIENGLIRENWVLVDMIDLLRQLEFDIFPRTNTLGFSPQDSN